MPAKKINDSVNANQVALDLISHLLALPDSDLDKERIVERVRLYKKSIDMGIPISNREVFFEISDQDVK
jgi:hypothetical protein